VGHTSCDRDILVVFSILADSTQFLRPGFIPVVLKASSRYGIRQEGLASLRPGSGGGYSFSVKNPFGFSLQSLLLATALFAVVMTLLHLAWSAFKATADC
jgi:hypothetical protein